MQAILYTCDADYLSGQQATLKACARAARVLFSLVSPYSLQ